MKTEKRECYPQDKCPHCGKFAVGYGPRRIKNNSKVMPAGAVHGDFIFNCPHCGTKLTLVTELLHNAETPAAIVTG